VTRARVWIGAAGGLFFMGVANLLCKKK